MIQFPPIHDRKRECYFVLTLGTIPTAVLVLSIFQHSLHEIHILPLVIVSAAMYMISVMLGLAGIIVYELISKFILK